MTIYYDDVVRIDDDGITIKDHLGPGHGRHISHRSIRAATVLEVGPLSGRRRLVGLGFRRPRHFFTWDRSRSSKTHAIALDTGRFFRTVISPADHLSALDIIEEQHAVSGTV